MANVVLMMPAALLARLEREHVLRRARLHLFKKDVSPYADAPSQIAPNLSTELLIKTYMINLGGPVMRNKLIVAALLWCVITPAIAQVNIGVSIGINVPAYPHLVRVPGYPVYYAPDLRANYFFYDGYYWVYHDDYWYQSAWYDGPWYVVDPFVVPVFVLRVPVRYYLLPPPYFVSWRHDAAPRWDEHWGNDWSRRRRGWDQWNRNAAPAPAPLPVYQRQYSGDRYPGVEQQRELQSKNYRYRPRTNVARVEQPQPTQRAPVTGRAAQEPSRSSADARRDERVEPRAPERTGPAREQQPSPQTQPRAQGQQPGQAPGEAAPRRNDDAQQPNRNQNADEEDQRNDRGNNRRRNRDSGRGR